MVDMTSVIYKQRSRSFILVSIHLTNIYILVRCLETNISTSVSALPDYHYCGTIEPNTTISQSSKLLFTSGSNVVVFSAVNS